MRRTEFAVKSSSNASSGLPPKPKMLHTMTAPNMPFTAAEGSRETDIEGDIDLLLDEEDFQNEEERKKAEKWHREIQKLNENDDRADVRDGIAETKGVKMQALGRVSGAQISQNIKAKE